MKSANSFNQWFRDVADVNQSMPLTLTLDNGKTTKGGVYTYQSNAFWPINSKMFGNQGLDKNFHFTFELHTDFTYRPGQYFTFVGDDDVWVYINGVRVIDLGGVHAAVDGSVLLFDGKAFVDKNDFPTSSTVLKVSSTMASQLATKWTALGLSGTCPIVKDDKYIDLGLLPASGAEARAEFPSSTSVKVWATKTLSAVTLKFSDYTEQTITSVSGTNGTFSGSGANNGKTIVGVYIKTTSDAAGSKGQYHSPEGVEGGACKLDFFFAERHTTQSNFRIDTSIQMISAPLNTISPSYD
jgi:fibro-slime domain-containing protein